MVTSNSCSSRAVYMAVHGLVGTALAHSFCWVKGLWVGTPRYQGSGFGTTSLLTVICDALFTRRGPGQDYVMGGQQTLESSQQYFTNMCCQTLPIRQNLQGQISVVIKKYCYSRNHIQWGGTLNQHYLSHFLG